MHHAGIVLRDEIHVVVEESHVRVVVDSPHMFLAALVVLWAVAIHFPIRNAVDAIRVRLFVGLLQPAPDVMLNVIL